MLRIRIVSRKHLIRKWEEMIELQTHLYDDESGDKIISLIAHLVEEATEDNPINYSNIKTLQPRRLLFQASGEDFD